MKSLMLAHPSKASVASLSLSKRRFNAIMANRSVTALASGLTGMKVERKGLKDLQWEHTFVNELPGDSEVGGGPRQVQSAFYSRVKPTSNENEPYLIAVSEEAADLLDLSIEECSTSQFVRALSGNEILEETDIYAQNYGGHQFGSWAGQLGDGRAMTLGEVVNSSQERWEVQLKGAGITPYSRRADGRAVLRSSIREFLGSEALFHLGIPTTRALSIIGTATGVWRDMFYDGNAKVEKGAVVCRLAPSFVRFGTFQLPAIRGGEQMKYVKTIGDYVLKYHFPDFQGPERFSKLYKEVVERTAKLAADWQCVGFVHGVLNTDNMSILGLTIDYGPYGFLERFNVNYTPNITDMPGYRYCYRNQPQAVMWNLAQLGSALATAELINIEEAQEILNEYGAILEKHYKTKMARKFGLSEYSEELSMGFMKLMSESGADFTNSFRALSEITRGTFETKRGLPSQLFAVLDSEKVTEEEIKQWKKWVEKYCNLLKNDPIDAKKRADLQDNTNPCYILRNHVCQDIIESAEKGDFEPLKDLLQVLKNPYTYQPGKDHYCKVVPEDKDGLGVSVLSCSS